MYAANRKCTLNMKIQIGEQKTEKEIACQF